MDKILILCASPRKNGNSATITEDLHTSFNQARVLFLYDYSIKPCIDCKACKNNNEEKDFCFFDVEENNSTKELFHAFLEADTIFIVSPIYFYHAPSVLKTFIDRSQRYWFQNQVNTKNYTKKIHSIFIASRSKGEKIPEGLNLSLKYFAPMVQASYGKNLCLYSLEHENDYATSIQAQELVQNFITHSQNLPQTETKQSFLSNLKDFFQQKRCVYCKTPYFPSQLSPLDKNIHSLCPQCTRALVRKTSGYCLKCGSIQVDGLEGELLNSCPICEEKPVEWSDLRFYSTYDGILKEMIRYAKFHNKFIYTHSLADLLLPILQEFEAFDCIVPMPMHEKKLKMRGYNQCHEIAKRLEKISSIPCQSNALIKSRNTQAQAGLARNERLRNLKNSFLADKEIVQGKTVLLLDDVSTTGSTLRIATKCLLKAGATKVFVLVIANGSGNID